MLFAQGAAGAKTSFPRAGFHSHQLRWPVATQFSTRLWDWSRVDY